MKKVEKIYTCFFDFFRFIYRKDWNSYYKRVIVYNLEKDDG